MAATTHPASYRDPAGHVFMRDGIIYRQVNQAYEKEYSTLMGSGLYETLTRKGMLLPHEEVGVPGTDERAWKIIKPRHLSFINYPYEWTFDQLQSAALLTLDIQSESMKAGMSLKDATPFNVTFDAYNRAVFIDSLSFEVYHSESPWIAYHQFCTTFLAPLLLASKRDPDLIRLLALHPEGIPLDLCSSLLPWSTKFHMLSALHIHLPARVKPGKGPEKKVVFSPDKLVRIIDHLRSGITALTCKGASNWSDYYEETILGGGYLEAKKKAVKELLSSISFQTVFDAGCNTGEFSMLLAGEGKQVVAADMDARSVHRLSVQLDFAQEKLGPRQVLPIVADLMNPPPAIGWGNQERPALLERIRTDLTMALALVHHLALGMNLPFSKMAETFSTISPWLLIEFVPKQDPKAQELIGHKRDIYADYDEQHFMTAFGEKYDLKESRTIGEMGRTLYLFRRKA